MTQKERMDALRVNLSVVRGRRMMKLLRPLPRELRDGCSFDQDRIVKLVEVVANLNARLKRLETMLKFKEGSTTNE